MKSISFDHMNLTVHNFEESVQWYGKVFGFELVEKGFDENKNPWGIVRNGDHMLCMYQDPQAEMPESGNPEHDKLHRIYHFGIRVHNRQEWEDTVTREKLRIAYGGQIRYPHSTSWYVQDPSGYEIEVSYWDNDHVQFS